MRFRLQTSILTSARWRCLRRDMALACHFLSAGAADRPCLTQPPCAGSCPPAAATNRTTEGGPTGTCSIGEHDPPPTSNRHLTVKEVCWRNGPPFGMVSSSFFPGGGTHWNHQRLQPCARAAQPRWRARRTALLHRSPPQPLKELPVPPSAHFLLLALPRILFPLAMQAHLLCCC